MAMQTILPNYLFRPAAYNAGSQNNTTLNTTDDWLAFVFYWPGGDLTKCAFLATSVSGSPVVTAQLFNTDPSDGGTTPVNLGSAIGSAVDSGTLVTTDIAEVSGIGQAALAAGVYALRLIFKSGTSCNIARGYNLGGGLHTTLFPFVVTVADGGAQTKATASGIPLALGGSVYVPVLGCVPPCPITGVTFQDTSTPDEFGLWFTNPLGLDIRICGFYFFKGSATAPDMRVAYYTGTLGSPTQVFTQTFDRDLLGAVNANGLEVQFATANRQTLAAGATAGIGVRANNTNNMTMYLWDFLSGNEAVMDMWWGQNATYFTREGDAGALTQTTFRTPLIFPVIDGIDTGGGAGVVPLSRPTIFWE